MKLLSTLRLFLCFLFVLPLSAQLEPNINELIARSKITTFKSINEVFTPQELSMLRNYYHGEENNNNVEKRGPQSWAFSKEDQLQKYGRVDTEDPSLFQEIGTTPTQGFEGAGAMCIDDYIAFVIDGNNDLYSVNVPTGVYTMLGQVIPPNGETFTDLEMDPTDNMLFAISSDGAQSSLSTINPETLAVTLIGITTLVVAISLAITITGELFTMDIDDDNIYQLNKLTAAALLIGAIGFDANFGQGMALNIVTGLIMLAAFNNDVFDSELRILNILTGITTLVGIMIIGTLAQFGWLAIPNPLFATEDNSLNRLTFYPNPVGDMLQIQSQTIVDNVTIYSMLGQRLLYQEVQASSFELDISNLSSGQYIVNTVSDGKFVSHKVIKQ